MQPRHLIRIGTLGFLGSALCCFTPLLVLALPVLGLAGAVAWLDRVLWPLMAAFAALVLLGLLLRRRARHGRPMAPQEESP